MKQFYVQVILLFFFGLMSQADLFGQTGMLAGSVIDGETKETLIGATIRVPEANTGAQSDFNGFYTIRNLEPGRYSCVVSYLGYEDVNITDIEIKPGENTTIDIVLSANSLVMNEVTVVEYRKTNTVAAVLLEVRQAKQVVSGVSSQQIQKSQDNNAAQVLQRVPGITIAESRFVMIRGLNERYNNVMVNNVTAPSTEIDRRTFSFDLISSSSLDRMLIYKSGAPEMPGDFAGGVIKLFTIEDVERNYTKLNLGVGYRVNTTGSDYFQSEGSSTDFLGFENGFRRLPSDFPSTFAFGSLSPVSEERKNQAHRLPNNFVANRSTALPDYSVGLSVGRNIRFKNGMRLNAINNISLSGSYQYYEREFNRFFAWEPPFDVPIDLRFAFVDDVYEKQNRISLLSNWRLKINDRNTVTFKNLFNQIGENETIIRNGFDFIQRPNDDLRNYLLGYRSRSIYLGQFEGSHELSNRRNIRWVLGGSFLAESEPDLRRFRTFRPKDGSEEGFIMQLPPSSNLFETGRYFGNMLEISGTQGLDYSWTAKQYDSGKKALLRAGYLIDYRNRNFDSRYFSYLYPGFFDPFEGERLRRLPLDQIFGQENVRTKDGFILEEGTRPIDSYTASSFTSAGYASAELPWRRFDIALGFRGEYNVQKVSTFTDAGQVEANNPIFAPLPFLNVGYSINDLTVLRLAYSRTVNRPEFRELAPFLFYDYKLEAGRIGNPDLKSAFIHNVDLRFEIYQRPGETFNIGGFYKYFNNPIENRTLITTEQPSFTYINADFAQNYGVEIEYRKSLRSLTNSALLDRFSVNANASLIWSKVDLGEQASAQDRVRALQGQSPYIVNVAIYYDDDQESGWSGSLVYNIFGDRIFSVGDKVFPSIYELSRHSLDLTFTKRFNRISYKLGIQNLLDAPFRFYEDSDRTEKIDLNRDNPVIVFLRGQLINFGISYDLNKR